MAARISEKALEEVEDAFERYRQAVEASNLHWNTKHTYIDRAYRFLRWLQGSYSPRAHAPTPHPRLSVRSE